MSFQELNKIHHFKSKSNDFVSEKENENTQKVSQNPNKHTWLYQQTFPGKEEADKWIDKQKIWSKNYSRETNAGRKQFYRCNLVPYRGQQCTAAVHLVFDAESLQVQQYYTAEEHNHDEIMVNRKTIGINNQTKQAINELLKLKIQVPKIIRNTLERQAETDPAIMVPSERQLNNYLQNQRGKVSKFE